MSTAEQKNRELLAWAASKIEAAQRGKVYGTVTIYLEGGTVTRSETKLQDMPGRKPGA